MKRSDSCSSCARGINVNVNKDILCRINGVVSRDFLCSKYLKLAWSNPESKPKCVECEFFIPSQDQSQKKLSYGVCQLFTVRNYDGEAKNACSKFCRKVERIIS